MTTRFEATVEIDRIPATNVPAVQAILDEMKERLEAENVHHDWEDRPLAVDGDRDLYIGIEQVDLNSANLDFVYGAFERIGGLSETAAWVDIKQDEPGDGPLFIGPSGAAVRHEQVRHGLARMRAEAGGIGGSKDPLSLVVGLEADGSVETYMVAATEENAVEHLRTVRDAVAEGRIDRPSWPAVVPDKDFEPDHAISLDTMALAACHPTAFNAHTIPRETIERAAEPQSRSTPGM